MQPYLEVALAAIGEARDFFLNSLGSKSHFSRKDVRDAQAAVEGLLIDFLRNEMPKHGIRNDDEIFKTGNGSDCTWYVGGLDIPRSYAPHGPLISLGMVFCHGPITGVIDAPKEGRQWYAAFQEGAFESVSGQQNLLSVSGKSREESRLVVLADDQRAAQLVADEPAADRRSCKSLTRSVLDILSKDADCYVQANRFSRSEFCPLDILLAEADGRTTDFRGSPVIYSNGDNSFARGLICSNGLGHNELALKAAKYLRSSERAEPHNL